MNRTLWMVAGLCLIWTVAACSSGADDKDVKPLADGTGEVDVVTDVPADGGLQDLVAELMDTRDEELPAELVEETQDSLGDALDAADGSTALHGEWVQLSNAQLGEHVLKGLWGFDDGNVVAVGEAGLVAALVQDTFVPAYQEPSLNILNGVWGSASTDIWTVGMYGLIYHYDGSKWGMPSYCKTVDDCSFAGECLIASCVNQHCEYSPTGKPQCCGADHFTTTLDEPADLSLFTFEDLYAGTAEGGLTWHVSSIVSPDGEPRYLTEPNALYFGDPNKMCGFDPNKQCPDFANGKPVGATATSPPITIPPTSESALLSFQLFLDVEASPFVDVVKVRVLNSGTWEDAWDKAYLSGNFLKKYVPVQVDLSKYVGKTIRFQFYFDSVTAENNALEGAYIDNITVSSVCSAAGSLAGKFPTLWSVWGTGPDSIYSVGSDGWILHYDGTSWQKHNGGQNFQMNGVHGLGADDITLAGKGGLVLHAHGNGWEQESAGLSKALLRVWTTSSERSVAVGSQGALAWYDGSTWHPSSLGGAGDLYDVVGISDSEYYIVGQTGKMLYYNGSDFMDVTNLPTTMNLFGVHGESGNNLTVVGDKVVLTGPSNNLVQEEVPIVAQWRTTWMTDQHRFVAGEAGRMIHFDGTKWNKMDTGVETMLLGLWGFGPDDVFAVGEGATIVHWDGEKWEQMEAFGTEETTFSDVWGAAPDDVYVTAQIEEIGYLLHWDGKSWKIALASTTAHLRHVHGTADDNVFAVGQGGTIVRYDGKGWGLLPVDPYIMEDGSEYYVTQLLHGVFAQAEDDVWAVGEQGIIVHYDGTSFSLAGMFDKSMRAVWGLSPENLWAVGGAGFILRFDGTQWYEEPSGTVATLYAIWGDDAENIYAVGDNGTILQYVAQ